MAYQSAQNHLQFGGGWQTGDAGVTYNSGDVINIKISGTGENEFDRLHLSPGTLTAGGAQLDVFLCSAPTPGDRFEIFKAQSVVGEFSNPQLMNVGGIFFVLSYEKDDAENDLIVLTAVAKIFGLTIKHSDTELDAPDEDRITQWDTYEIYVVADPGAGGTVSASQTICIVCDEITIEATANVGYAFTHWTQEGGAIIANTASPTTTATMPARDVTITAHFEHLLPEAPTAVDLTVCYDGAEHSAGANPPDNSEVVWYTEDLPGTITTTAPTGTNPDTYKAWAASKHDVTGFESATRTEVTLTINALPTMNCPDDYEVCVDAPAFALSGATPANGTYSGPGVTGGEFNPSVAGVGTHTISYSYTDPATDCTNTCTFTITVNALPVMECPANNDVCIDAPAFALTGATPANGTYSGPGVSGSEFNPSVAGVGTHTISYSFTDTNGCTNTCTFTITVNALPGMECPANNDVCIDAPAFSLSDATPTGGTYNGPGVTGSEFNPSIAGVGTHTIVYTYINSNSCTASCVFTISVNPNNTITHDAGSGGTTQEVCVNIAIAEIKYTTTSADGADVTGLPAGVTGTFTANVVTISGTPTVAGIFNYEIELTGGCGNVTATGTITVNANNTINLTSAIDTDDQTVCIDIAIAEITYTTTGAEGADVTGLPAGVTGTFSANQVTISGTPSVAGTHNYTVTMTGGCGNGTATGTITVNPLPDPPTTLPATGISTNTFTAHWTELPGAVTYTLEVALDEVFTPSELVDEIFAVGTTSHTVVGLVSNTTYHYRVKATDACGESHYSDAVSVTTTSDAAFPCPENITFTYRGASVTYGVIERGGLCWMDRNLGADPMPFVPADDATGNTDTRLYGDLFQWGRLDDHHQDRSSGTTGTQSSNPNPGHSKFITNDLNWYNGSDPDDLWQEDGTGINNPCPEDWRVPTRDELNAERESWTAGNNRTGAFESTLKWPVGGFRDIDGEFDNVDANGYVWSSSVSDTYASSSLFFYWDGALMSNVSRTRGASVRCVRDVPECELPPAPEATEATDVTTKTFTANWTEVPGALNYTLDVARDDAFSDFVDGYEDLDVNDATSHTVVGLVSNTTYHYRVKATDACGESDYSDAVSVTTASDAVFPCPENITFNYRGASVTYGVIERGGLCWMDRNLGALKVPDAKDDHEGYGDLFQWGRADEGHQLRGNNDHHSGQANTHEPNTGADWDEKFITGSIDWLVTLNDDLWQGEDGINNPCPPGWRVPTRDELNAERESWTEGNNSAGAYASTLKWPVGGIRDHTDGTLHFVGSHGGMWSSHAHRPNVAGLYIGSDDAKILPINRADGISVRCVRDLPDCEIPPAPTALPATGISTNTFTAHWEAVSGAVTYTLQVALDDGFSEFVDGYQNLDVGANTSYIVGGLSPTTTYYYRVKVTDDCGTSGYSGTVSVTTEAATTELKIGDSHQGGIIAYILQPGDSGYIDGEVHGLIAAPTDQSTGAQWGCDGTSIGGTSTALGTGAANTTAILECTTAGIAARICNDLDLNGYTDWYLPSKDELNKLYINREAIGGFASGGYWSSSEYSSNLAWLLNFGNGYQGDSFKYNYLRVRAVRAF